VEPSQDSRVATEEVFGPALPVWRVRDMDEALERANSLIFGLGSSIWTRDLDRASEAAEKIEAGYTWINSPRSSTTSCPSAAGSRAATARSTG
jgi:succinate-semialdehyde dehydrogenase/glutarate-semialdehyde dehydrogenase